MRVIQRLNDTILTSQKDISQEVTEFYISLMGKSSNELNHVDIEALRRENQLNIEQKEILVSPITVIEMEEALQGIGDLKSPGGDGYGSKIFKTYWHIIRLDVVDAVMEFFEQDRLYAPFNQTVVTLVPKTDDAKFVRDIGLLERELSIGYKRH
ncbi:unnamed protein product [Lathyrus sativus]|nr:unnamed protein product [Lathyrus sativus]